MALDFPTSPTNGQAYGGYIYNAANDTWDSAYAPRAATIPISSPNYVINGAFDINQRNFTSTTINTAYGHDRWALETGSGTSTYSTQAFTAGAAPVVGYEASSFARIVTSGQTGTVAYSLLEQHIEDVRTLAGQTVVVSFWAKAGSATPKIAVSLDQRFGSGGSPSAIVTTPVGVVTTSTAWARYSVSVALPALTGKTIGTTANTSSLLLRLWVSASAALDPAGGGIGIQNNTFDIWGVQVEQGAVATDFRRNAPSIQGELAACQRYYYRATAESIYGQFCYAWGDTTTSAFGQFVFPVTMRTKPSAVEWTGTGSNYSLSGTGSGSVSNIAFSSNGSSSRILELQITGSSIVAGRPYFLGANNNALSYIGVSAEL